MKNINSVRIKFISKKFSFRLMIYALLTGIGVVYLYPILYMIVNSFKSLPDLVNPTVEWIPSGIYFENYAKALTVLDYGSSLLNSIFIVSVSTVFQTLSCALAGYSLARFNIPLKKLWMVLIVLTFLIPAQVIMIPKFAMFSEYGLIGTPLSIFLPAAFGQGVNSSIFILIFYQFFISYPKSFDEAAKIDGAGNLKIFLKIAVPLCVPAIIVSLLFSFIWFWNETSMTGLLLGNNFRTLPMKLQSFVEEFNRTYVSGTASGMNRINEGIQLAATLLVIAPLLVLYLGLQKFFIEGIESVGLTGE